MKFKKMTKVFRLKTLSVAVGMGILTSCFNMGLASAELNRTLLYIPQDNRPISYTQTVDNIKDLGYEVLTPPEDIIGNREHPQGNSQALATWAQANVKKADVAVISADAMLYGSLVASRKEDHEVAQTLANVENIAQLRQANPHMKFYVFGSIMRTPQSIQASGGTDAAIYAKYGTDIAKYTALVDKSEQTKLTRKEKKALQEYKSRIPAAALQGWLDLRKANLLASKSLIDLVSNGTIDYLALGADDNAKYSQTSKERRELDNYAQALDTLHYQSVAGIDEIGYVLLVRGVNQLKGDIPFVAVHYAPGKGAATIPAYSNEPIADSIKTHITMAGGLQINHDDHADEIFMVNTTEKGTTGAANNPDNTATITPHTAAFVRDIAAQVKAGRNVSVADVAFANGASNSLMNGLYQANLLSKLGGYAGWNTPTNSSGYAVAMGMTSKYATKEKLLNMLEVRYLDDWLYQANARQTVANHLASFPGKGAYMSLDEKLEPAEIATTGVIRELANNYGLPTYPGQEYVAKVKVTFPWNRMFEAGFVFPEKNNK